MGRTLELRKVLGIRGAPVVRVEDSSQVHPAHRVMGAHLPIPIDFNEPLCLENNGVGTRNQFIHFLRHVSETNMG